jgi:hypothetical protein
MAALETKEDYFKPDYQEAPGKTKKTGSDSEGAARVPK